MSRNETPDARFYYYKGDSLNNIQKYDSAFYYFNQAKMQAEEEKDSVVQAYSLCKMASIQQIFGDYSGSEVTLVEIFPYVQQNPILKSGVYNLLGISAKETYNYDEALLYFKMAKDPLLDDLNRRLVDNNIGRVYIKKKQYDKAVVVLNDAIRNLKVNDSTKMHIALFIDNLGFAYYKSGKIKKGLDCLKEGLRMRDEMGDGYGAIASYLHLAEFYQKTNSQKSDDYARKAYRNSTIHKLIDGKLAALAFLMSNNYTLGKNKYVDKYLALNDSIDKVKFSAKNQFAKMKYDSKKVKKENQYLKLEKSENLLQLEKVKSQRLIFFLWIIVLVFSIVLLIKYFKNKARREKGKTIYETETRISKELHDELANDVFQTLSFVEVLEIQNSDKRSILIDRLDKIYKGARGISRKNSFIDTGGDFESNLKNMLMDFETDTTKIIIKGDSQIKWNKVHIGSKVVTYRVLQELMVNMKKHSSASLVLIGFKNSEKGIQFSYADNGVGISNLLKLKNGLKNVENRIRAINGVITFETQNTKGFKVNFTLPK